MTIKNLVVSLLAMVALVFAGNVHADTIKAGAVLVDGHSYDGTYGVNNKGPQSWGVNLSYDVDGLRKDISKHQTIGLDYGAMLDFFRITITENEEVDGDYYAHGKGNYKVKGINSLIVGVYPKAWYELYGVRTFIAPVVGAELADDGESAPMVGGTFGFEKLFTKHVGASIQHSELWTTKRRFEATSINLMVRF